MDNLNEYLKTQYGALNVYTFKLYKDQESSQFPTGVYLVSFGHTGGYISGSHIGLAIFTDNQSDDRWDSLIPITQNYNGGAYQISFNPSKRKFKMMKYLESVIPYYAIRIFGEYNF